MKRGRTVVYGLLVVFLVLAVSSMVQKSPVLDEVPHIAAGYSYWMTGDFRLNPEHPPLVKLLSGLPLLAVQPRMDLDDPHWQRGDEWLFGSAFLFKHNDNADTLLFLGRLPIVLLGLLLGFFVFLWSSALFGRKAGLFALVLYVFSPNILAHTRLITTDLAVTTFGFIAMYFLWKFCTKEKEKDLLWSGGFLGFALASKYTALFFLGIWIFCLGHWYYSKQGKLLKIRKPVLLALIIAVIVVALSYFIVNVPLYLDGLDSVLNQADSGKKAFLFGEQKVGGWWYYFIAAFLIKTPIAMLLLLGFCLYQYKKIYAKKKNEIIFVLIPPLAIFIIFCFTKLNIGLRHILPVYPFLFVLVSGIVGVKLFKKKHQKMFHYVLYALLTWYIFASLLIYPNYLAYFNEAVGGPSQGYHYLIDSNLDWGQDLKGLQWWMENNQKEEVYLFYFGRDKPQYREINYQPLPCIPTLGTMVISASALQGIEEKFNSCYWWLHNYEPIDSIGYSLLVYEIDTIKLAPDELECYGFCAKKCAYQDKELLLFKEDRTEKGLGCSCTCKA